ncbi:MAG: hypothetical protein QF737_05130, partial [Dehalococcoidales bacterium]|nr:hypothetical protein [Dehalococcoidales bacterium]
QIKKFTMGFLFQTGGPIREGLDSFGPESPYTLGVEGPLGDIGEAIPSTFNVGPLSGGEHATGFWGIQDAQRHLARKRQDEAFAFQASQIRQQKDHFGRQQTYARGAALTRREYQVDEFGISDRMRDLNRKAQLSNQVFQERQFGFRREEMDMGRTEQAMRQTEFGWRRQWQLEDRQLGAWRMQSGRQWQLEDRASQDTRRGLQQAWQTEDIDEQIRFSTGRQRRLLLRQRGRMTTMRNLDEEQIVTQRGREDELWEKEEEQFKKRIEREDMLFKHEEKRFEFAEKRFEMSVERFDLELARFEEQKERVTAQWGLEDERNDLMKERAKKEYDLQIARLDMEKVMAEERWTLQEEYNTKMIAFYNEQKDLEDISIQLQRTYYIEQQEAMTEIMGAVERMADVARSIQLGLGGNLGGGGEGEGGGEDNGEDDGAPPPPPGHPETHQTGGSFWAYPGDTFMQRKGRSIRRISLAEQGPERITVAPTHAPGGLRSRGSDNGGGGNVLASLQGVKLELVVDGKAMDAYLRVRDRKTLYAETFR